MIEIEKPNIVTLDANENETKATFVVEPLERGYGTTLGNSLRRILLSSLPGVAVVSIKIDGVVHEISDIPGVKEDVPEIVLNVKGITRKDKVLPLKCVASSPDNNLEFEPVIKILISWVERNELITNSNSSTFCISSIKR